MAGKVSSKKLMICGRTTKLSWKEWNLVKNKFEARNPKCETNSKFKTDIAAKRRKKHKGKYSIAVFSIGYKIEIPER
jgi:hypothetical protein